MSKLCNFLFVRYILKFERTLITDITTSILNSNESTKLNAEELLLIAYDVELTEVLEKVCGYLKLNKVK